MKHHYLRNAVQRIFFATGLFTILLSVASCEDPMKPISDRSLTTNNNMKLEDPVSDNPEDSPEELTKTAPVSTPDEAVARYESVVKKMQEMAAGMQTQSEQDYALLLKKVATLKGNADDAGNYLAHHRKDFSADQLKKIDEATGEISEAMNSILATRDK